MQEMLKMDIERTRNLYRAIACHNEIGYRGILGTVTKGGGIIGCVSNKDCWIIEGRGTFCERHRLENLNEQYLSTKVADADAVFYWHFDSIWMPAQAEFNSKSAEHSARAGVPLTLMEDTLK